MPTKHPTTEAATIARERRNTKDGIALPEFPARRGRRSKLQGEYVAKDADGAPHFIDTFND